VKWEGCGSTCLSLKAYIPHLDIKNAAFKQLLIPKEIKVPKYKLFLHLFVYLVFCINPFYCYSCIVLSVPFPMHKNMYDCIKKS